MKCRIIHHITFGLRSRLCDDDRIRVQVIQYTETFACCKIKEYIFAFVQAKTYTHTILYARLRVGEATASSIVFAIGVVLRSNAQSSNAVETGVKLN